MKKTSGILLILITIFVSGCVDKTAESAKYVREGNLYLYGSNPDEAYSLYQKALELNPENPEAWYGTGTVWMNRRQYQKAIENFTKAIDLKPNYTDAFYNRGQAWFYKNENYKACEDWQKAYDLGKPNMGDKLKKCR